MAVHALAAVLAIPPAITRLIEAPSQVQRAAIESLAPAQQQALLERVRHAWPLWARTKQLPPEGDWRWWVICAGRSFGKTRAGSEFIRACAESGRYRWLSICGPTAGTVYRDNVTGPSGLISISPPWFRPVHNPSKLQLLYPPHPVTGVRTRVALLSADAPERIRGSQHEILYCDEPQSWTRADVALSNLDLGLRLGPSPRAVITLTPKPTEFVRSLVLGPKSEDGKRNLPANVVVTRGSTYENTTLDPSVLEAYRSQYEGTRTGAQELNAEIFERPERALFREESIEKFRVSGVPCAVTRIVLGVDPSRSRWGAGDMAGGVIVALGDDGDIYVFADVTTRGTPLQWIKHFAAQARQYRVDVVVYEQNRLDSELHRLIGAETAGQKWESRTASEAKAVRMEPVAAAVEAGRIHFVGRFPELEEQLVGFDPTARNQADDRADAFTWAARELLADQRRVPMRLVNSGGRT